MGVGTSNSGKINVTDMDTIELSNLSRQFLYRASDINKSKSDTLVNKITSYKDNYKNTFNAFNYEVGKNSEDIFCKKWWKSHDIVINALDNVEARKYVDSCCNKYDIPLFESGTLGTKANSQPIIPYETATYSEIKDIKTDSIPMCTIRNFPNKIEHCVEWGLELFNKIITQVVIDYNDF